jgi:hypothetical protein
MGFGTQGVGRGAHCASRTGTAQCATLIAPYEGVLRRPQNDKVYDRPRSGSGRRGINVTIRSAISRLQTIAFTLFIIAGCAAGLPFALGYFYAWTWVLPYTSVCKSSLLESNFTAEEYHIYLLNHGCDVDDEIRRYVRDWYAGYPQDKVEASTKQAVLIFHGNAKFQSADDVILADAVKSYLSRFRSFHFAEEDSFWGDDVVSQFFAWLSGKYLAVAGPLLLIGIDLGAVQAAAVWEEGPLLRGGLLIAYTLATGVIAAALFEFVKWRSKS